MCHSKKEKSNILKSKYKKIHEKYINISGKKTISISISKSTDKMEIDIVGLVYRSQYANNDVRFTVKHSNSSRQTVVTYIK